MLAAVLGKGLIESHGWQSVFLAAAAPVVLIPFILKYMPESLPFLIKQRDDTHLRDVVRKIRPDMRFDRHVEFLVPAEDKAKGPTVGRLFLDGDGKTWLNYVVERWDVGAEAADEPPFAPGEVALRVSRGDLVLTLVGVGRARDLFELETVRPDVLRDEELVRRQGEVEAPDVAVEEAQPAAGEGTRVIGAVSRGDDASRWLPATPRLRRRVVGVQRPLRGVRPASGDRR